MGLYVGCGIGGDILQYGENGFSADGTDLPGPTLEFTKWRVQKRGLGGRIRVLASKVLKGDENNPRPGDATKYHAITCVEVLMYFNDPINIMRGLAQVRATSS